MAWLRYGKKMHLVTTEVGPWNSDVLGVSDKLVIEIEVKKSKADLLAEFRNKGDKHSTYEAAADGTRTATVPNYLYFIVPEPMWEYALQTLDKKAPKAGLLVVDPESNERDGKKTRVVKKATRLHANPPAKNLTRQTCMRMSSELVGMHVAYGYMRQSLMTQIDLAVRGSARAALRVAGTLDLEDVAADMERRAAELAFVISKVPLDQFGSLPAEEQKLWKERAQELLNIQSEGVPDEALFF